MDHISTAYCSRINKLKRSTLLSCDGSKSITKMMEAESLLACPPPFLNQQQIIEEAPGVWVYGSLTRRCVIVDPFTAPSLTTRRPCRRMTAQTGSVWLGYTEQTLAATWWLDTAYICSPNQHRWGPLSTSLLALCSGSATLSASFSFASFPLVCPETLTSSKCLK